MGNIKWSSRRVIDDLRGCRKLNETSEWKNDEDGHFGGRLLLKLIRMMECC